MGPSLGALRGDLELCITPEKECHVPGQAEILSGVPLHRGGNARNAGK